MKLQTKPRSHELGKAEAIHKHKREADKAKQLKKLNIAKLRKQSKHRI